MYISIQVFIECNGILGGEYRSQFEWWYTCSLDWGGS